MSTPISDVAEPCQSAKVANVRSLLALANAAALHKALLSSSYADGRKAKYRSVARWTGAKGQDPPPEMVDPILEAFGLLDKEKPPPWWGAAEDRLIQAIEENRNEIKRLVDPMRGDVTALVRDMERGHAAGDEGSSPRPSGAVAPANKSTQDGRDATPPPTRSPQSRVRRKK